MNAQSQPAKIAKRYAEQMVAGEVLAGLPMGAAGVSIIDLFG